MFHIKIEFLSDNPPNPSSKHSKSGRNRTKITYCSSDEIRCVQNFLSYTPTTVLVYARTKCSLEQVDESSRFQPSISYENLKHTRQSWDPLLGTLLFQLGVIFRSRVPTASTQYLYFKNHRWVSLSLLAKVDLFWPNWNKWSITRNGIYMSWPIVRADKQVVVNEILSITPLIVELKKKENCSLVETPRAVQSHGRNGLRIIVPLVPQRKANGHFNR